MCSQCVSEIPEDANMVEIEDLTPGLVYKNHIRPLEEKIAVLEAERDRMRDGQQEKPLRYKAVDSD